MEYLLQTSYRPSYLECSLPNNVLPTHVSISFQDNTTSTNRLQIIYPGPRIRNFTVCYSVLHSGFNMTSKLIESIELNRLLGAEHFLVYNYSVSPQVDEILSRYQQDGIVTVLAWPLPTKSSWYFAQMTALNDCFYRNRNISRFVVVVDTDEVIVPRNHYNWMDLINSASSKESDISTFSNSSQSSTKGNLTSCFIVRSSYFSNDKIPDWNALPSQFPFGDDEKKNIMKYAMLILSQYWRQEYIFDTRVRSKYIARPECVYNYSRCLSSSIYMYILRDTSDIISV
uniref:Glycosyltransferase family 92 protein n=1 Tax=Arion vulgaris TaxID=1028688 RepID=A0A0B7BVE0_9EUPU